MDNEQNYVDIEVHNKIMQNLRQRQLEYKTKIIEVRDMKYLKLEKQKQYEINRANEYQDKFKEALLSQGNQVELVDKLSLRQNQNNQLRMEIIRLKKNLDTMAQTSSASKTSHDSAQLTKQLTNQNQQLVKTIQQLKNAAISAIMAKDDQIQQLNEKLSKASDLAVLYQNLLEREQILERQIEKIRTQAQEQQKMLSEKLSKQREKYLQKLEEFQNNLHNEESTKQELLQKAQLLQTNLQNKEQIIYLYQNKLNQFEGAFRQQRQVFEQEKDKLAIEVDNLKDRISLYEKEITNLEKVVSQFSFKERQSKILNQRLKDQNSELERKLTIKKRKNNPKMRSSDIYSSFQGISQKSSFYSSFYKPTQQSKPSNLGQIQELEENDVLDSFIDLEERGKYEDEDNKPNLSKKKQKSMEIDVSQVQGTEQNGQQQALTKEPQEETKIQSQIQSAPQASLVQKAELEKLKNSLLEHQRQIKDLRSRNETLQRNLDQSYSQIERLTKQILAKTAQIQTQRQTLAQLRSQNKKSQNEKELIVELENFKQHVFKLQNALLIQKLQNAQKQEFMKERSQRQRKAYESKINQLGDQLKNLSPKKKKGFFR